VQGTLRPSGAIRYRCPVTGSFVLLTDAGTLARLAERVIRLRCADCGEMHLVMQSAPALDADGIVGEPVNP